MTVVEPEPIHTNLAERVALARLALLDAARRDWRCDKCGSPIEKEEPMRPDLLRNQVEGFTGPELMIATTGLVRDGVFVLDDHLRLLWGKS